MESLTVVVPVYNVARFIGKCVDSLLCQTLPIERIILVDDGSIDESGNLCDMFAARHSNILVLHQQNGGLSAARNAGLDAARSEYIAFVDSDDYVEKTMYESMMTILRDQRADIVKCGVWYEQENGERYAPYPAGISAVWSKREALVELNSYQYFNMSFCDAIFRRSLFEQNGASEKLRFPVGKLSEDYFLMHQVIARADTVAYTSAPYYHYIQRPNSISRNKRISLAPMEASLAQLAFFERHFPDLADIARAACAFSHMGIYTAHIREKVDCPKALLKQLRRVSRCYLPSVLACKRIPPIKKMQAIAFCYALPVYRLVIARTAHR